MESKTKNEVLPFSDWKRENLSQIVEKAAKRFGNKTDEYQDYFESLYEKYKSKNSKDTSISPAP